MCDVTSNILTYQVAIPNHNQSHAFVLKLKKKDHIMSDTYIGISENRMKHILGVARKSYQLAKEKYHLDEEYARKAFVFGFNHDIGYEFSKSNIEHPQVGYDLLLNAFGHPCEEIRQHGNDKSKLSLYLMILDEADLSVDSKGNFVTVKERLDDILSRYSITAPEYTKPLKLAKKLNLI